MWKTCVDVVCEPRHRTSRSLSQATPKGSLSGLQTSLTTPGSFHQQAGHKDVGGVCAGPHRLVERALSEVQARALFLREEHPAYGAPLSPPITL
jgi:hypothetical protein